MKSASTQNAPLLVSLSAALACAAASASAVPESRPEKKFVALAWEFNEAWPKDFLAAADAFDETALDGVGIFLKGCAPDGSLVGMRDIFTAEWTYEAFAPQIPGMREMTKHRAFRECFGASFRSPPKSVGRVAWEDDATWARVARNMRTAARVVREAGFRGLGVDCEDYGKVEQFLRQPGEKPFDELAALARRRGAEVFGGAFEEYPEITILSFWLLSWVADWYDTPDVAGFVRDRGDLWPAFVNGVLDVMPPTATLIDGNENAYRYEAENNRFHRKADRVRRAVLPLVAPENREKYSRQVQVSFGQYLDMYTHPTNSPWSFPPLDGSRLERFRANFDQAVRAADEYVWLWGEQYHFTEWKDGYVKNPSCREGTWDERLPGLADMLKFAKDPVAFGRERMAALEAEGRLVNLVGNGGCRGEGTGVPAPFGTWRADKGEGGGTLGRDGAFGEGDDSSLCATGAVKGSFLFTLKGVKGGEYYVVEASALGEGVSACVSWKDAKGKYVGRALKMAFAGDAGGWRHGFAAVRIPAGAVRMTLSLDAHLADGEKAWFDNVGVYRLRDAPAPEPEP